MIRHPFVLCTDDKGAFDTNLSKEYAEAQKVLGLTDQSLFELSQQSIEMTFATIKLKNDMKLSWKKWWVENSQVPRDCVLCTDDIVE